VVPALAIEVDDPELDPANFATSTHNSSRREQRDGAYSKIQWQCQHGHVWKSTVLNRVRGGGCPKCSTVGTSKEQVRVAAELSGLLELIQPDPPDPRIPDGIPDLGSSLLIRLTALRRACYSG